MSDRPTPAEIDAGEHAVLVLLHEHHGVPQSWRTIVDRVLCAVLPGHDARLRAEVAQAIEAAPQGHCIGCDAAVIARAHTTGGDHE